MVSMFTSDMLNEGGPFVWHHHIDVDGPANLLFDDLQPLSLLATRNVSVADCARCKLS